jgi:hypothetical protein
MNINEPTRPNTDASDRRIMPSPVTFSPIPDGANRTSPVVLHDTHSRLTPVSAAEVWERIAVEESEEWTDTSTPTIMVEDSFFAVEEIAPLDFILKERHKDLATGRKVVIRTEDGSQAFVATVVQCWQLVAGDIDDAKAKALGWENAEMLADDRGWHDDDWATRPVTVIQIKR